MRARAWDAASESSGSNVRFFGCRWASVSSSAIAFWKANGTERQPDISRTVTKCVKAARKCEQMQRMGSVG
eukprot:scaffold137931_cov36-Tisochrysis_lutea.AAC.5